MQLKGTLAVLASLLLSAVSSSQAALCDVKINDVEVNPETLANHHTSHFNLKETGGFAVRRAQPFQLVVKTEQDLNLAKTEALFVNSREEAFNNPAFTASVKTQIAPRQYLVEVGTSTDAPIGKYENITLTIKDESNTCDNAGEAFKLTKPVYLLFNPWSTEDDVVYMPNETMRQEHVVNDYGNVFQGSAKAYDAQVWHYGQSNQVVLDAAFHLIEKDRANAHDPIKVMQVISRHQGMQRRLDGSFIWGDDNALLEGNWGDFPFTEKDAPELWTSSVDILNRWKATGKPTKYGQCWVFAALLNSLLRGVGVGSRQLTAFGSWMDASNRHDAHHRFHHVIDEYYSLDDGAMKTIYLDGVAWNFHSWTDVWIKRGGHAKYDGWQSMDGTPPGRIGPAPVLATHDLDETVDFQVGDIISTVHSTTRTFLVHCQPNHTKAEHLKGCIVEKMIKYDHTGLKLLLTTATLPNGTFGEIDVTKDYIDPNKDARIPYETEFHVNNHDLSPHIMLASGATPSAPNKLRGFKTLVGEGEEDNLSIRPTTYGVVVGSPISGDIDLKTAGLIDGESVEVILTATLETYHGTDIKTIFKTSQKVLIKGRLISLPFFIDASAYLQHDLGDVFIKLVAVASSDAGQHYFDKAVLDVTSPSIYFEAPQSVIAGATEGGNPKPFTVHASFRNPLQFPVRNLCISIHSHVLDFHNMPTNVTKISHCENVGAGDLIRIAADLNAPTEPGVYFVLASIQGEYLPYGQSNAVISALPGKAAPLVAPEAEAEVFLMAEA